MRAQGLREQSHQVVLVPERKHRIDEVVPNARIALLDFKAVGDEVEKLSFYLVERTECRINAAKGVICGSVAGLRRLKQSMEAKLILPPSRIGEIHLVINEEFG